MAELRQEGKETTTAIGPANGANDERPVDRGEPARADQGGPPGQPDVGRPGDEKVRRRYGLLLVILIATYLLSAFFSYTWITYVKLGLIVIAGSLALRNSPFRGWIIRLVVMVALGGSSLVILIEILSETDGSRVAAAVWIGLTLLLTVVLLIRQILQMPEVTMQSIYGAISAYLVMGLMFATFYAAMYYLSGRHFFAQGSQYHRPADFQYFSFTTLTTLGYGDFTARYDAGRTVAMIEAMSGQIFLATLVAKLVSSFRPALTAARKTTGQVTGDARGTEH